MYTTGEAGMSAEWFVSFCDTASPGLCRSLLTLFRDSVIDRLHWLRDMQVHAVNDQIQQGLNALPDNPWRDHFRAELIRVRTELVDSVYYDCSSFVVDVWTAHYYANPRMSAC